jgi:hypothetical protein
MIKKISDFYVLYIGGNGKKIIGCDFSDDGTREEGYQETWSENIDTLRRCSNSYLCSLGLTKEDINFVKRQ